MAAIITYSFGAACLTKVLCSLFSGEALHRATQIAGSALSKERDHRCTTQPKENKYLDSRLRHDLRNSLNVVMGFADLLSAETAGTLNEKQQFYVHNIRVGTRQMFCLLRSKNDGIASEESSDSSESLDEAAQI